SVADRSSGRSLPQEFCNGILSLSPHAIVPFLLFAQLSPANVLLWIVVRRLALIALHPEAKPVQVALEGGDSLKRRIKRVSTLGITVKFDHLAKPAQRDKKFKTVLCRTRVLHQQRRCYSLGVKWRSIFKPVLARVSIGRSTYLGIVSSQELQ